MGLNSLSIISITRMRIYFTDPAIVSIENIQNKLIRKSTINKIYSTEGIFHIINNKINRLIVTDVPNSEKISIVNIDFIIDRSSFTYDTECYQLNPNHISETVYIQTYFLTDCLQLVVETCNNINEIYFTTDDANYDINYDKHIRTFLSELNLC
jgi:hypothetical protein